MINKIKKKITENIGKYIEISIQGSRNKQFKYKGIIKETYDNIFLIENTQQKNIKCLSYADILTGTITYVIKDK